MEQNPATLEGKKFNTPEEELAFLRQEVQKREQALAEKGERIPREELIEHQMGRYKQIQPEEVLEKGHRIIEPRAEEIALDLAPEEHDEQMAEFLDILQEKGVRNTLLVIEKMNNPHLEDDFHRILVQYIAEGFPIKDIKEGSALWKPLHMTLYEVALPKGGSEERERQLKDLLSSMEQFYAGMFSVADKKTLRKNYFTLEAAVARGSEEAIFYVAVANDKKDLFEEQVLSIFPNAKVVEQKNDYNIFNTDGFSVGSTGAFSKKAIFPIKMYDEFDYDPLNSILSAFSKIARDDEGAAIQFIVSPAGDYYTNRYKRALDKIHQGVKVKDAINVPESFLGSVAKGFGDVFGGSKTKKKEERIAEPVDQIVVEQITNKIQSPIASVNVRVLASAKTQARAEAILSHLEAGFNQFEKAQGNRIIFKRISLRKLKGLVKNFSFRLFVKDKALSLNLKELTALYHLSAAGVVSSRELKQARAKTAPAPVEMPATGVLLGVNKYGNRIADVRITAEDRLRHFYTVGQTGTGKTTLLKNMIIQDIEAGEGVCMIDPHGIDIVDVLNVVPKERFNDVIYFDPGYTSRPMALNMLEYDERFPEQKTFVVNELFNIFMKLYGTIPESMGPIFEQYFRNAAMLVVEDPSSGSTLLDVSRVLADAQFRHMKLSQCKNPIVVQFWQDIAEKAGGESQLANIVPYITSKFDVFLTNDIMRPIIAQQKSTFNFREIMDERKILLVNLAKGRLGDINSNLLGLILVGKILMAALSRVDSTGEKPPFYLYIDEFQNVTTDSIATILSEARKYNLGLTIAHQFIAQLEEKIRNAVFGNVGTICSFRVGADDAEYLKQQFEPVFTASDLINLDNRNAYLKLLVEGRPVTPFNIETLSPKKGEEGVAEQLKELSYEKYGGDLVQIEEQIREKYRSML